MRKLCITSGIQKKYLKYTIALLILALLLGSSCIEMFMNENLTQTIRDKYQFADEKIARELDNIYRQSEEATAEAIVNNNVQKSLRTMELEEVEKIAVGKYFSYMDIDWIADFCYVDNKQNVYSSFYNRVDYEAVRESGFEKRLEDNYAKTVWFWTKDTLFGSGKDTLFIGRYVRSMEYAHEPGMLFLKMKDTLLTDIMRQASQETDGCITGIMDGSGNVCVASADVSEIPEKILKQVEQSIDELNRSGWEEHLTTYYSGDSGFTVFTYVPASVINQEITHMQMVLVGIFFLVILIAIALSVWMSRRFTEPIQNITRAMTGFDGKDFTKIPELHTQTEVDQIGQSYNDMLGNIEHLVEEIKIQEKELHNSELNLLISQINPHFLYNTLDTIYMLARINKEEITMKMIQALSKYLRLSLSKGSDIVTVGEELENVRNYMEIQQIRNANLFRYEIDCQVDEENTKVLKLILQPLVENAIKHGFQDIYEGGYIHIWVYKDTEMLTFRVYNSGTPMEQEIAERINALKDIPVSSMKDIFPDQSHGYGVVNIISRLRLRYGDSIAFSTR